VIDSHDIAAHAAPCLSYRVYTPPSASGAASTTAADGDVYAPAPSLALVGRQLRLSHAAEIAGLCTRTLTRARDAGELHCTRRGRLWFVAESELMRWFHGATMHSNCTGASSDASADSTTE
jgi:hypothetical protein